MSGKSTNGWQIRYEGERVDRPIGDTPCPQPGRLRPETRQNKRDPPQTTPTLCTSLGGTPLVDEGHNVPPVSVTGGVAQYRLPPESSTQVQGSATFDTCSRRTSFPGTVYVPKTLLEQDLIDTPGIYVTVHRDMSFPLLPVTSRPPPVHSNLRSSPMCRCPVPPGLGGLRLSLLLRGRGPRESLAPGRRWN